MKEQTFQLSENQEFIQLNSLLKVLQLAQTGGHAKIIILNGEVKVNGLVDIRVRKKLYKTDIVEIADHSITII